MLVVLREIGVRGLYEAVDWPVGASSTYLTPIGHQSNLLVMGPGGYRFGDYWRMGLPLDLLIVALAVPLILAVWPL